MSVSLWSSCDFFVMQSISTHMIGELRSLQYLGQLSNGLHQWKGSARLPWIQLVKWNGSRLRYWCLHWSIPALNVWSFLCFDLCGSIIIWQISFTPISRLIHALFIFCEIYQFSSFCLPFLYLSIFSFAVWWSYLLYCKNSSFLSLII